MIRLPFSSLRSRPGAVLAFAAVLLASACSEPAPPPAPPAPPVKTAQERVQLYKDCWNHYNAKDLDKFGQCFTETAVSEQVDSAAPPRNGRAAIIDDEKRFMTAFPDGKGDLQLVLQSGGHVAGIALLTATNSGPMPPGPDGKSLPATNKKIGVLIGHTVELDSTGARAAKETAYVEEGTMLAQLGIIPNPTARKAMAATGAPATVVIAANDDKERNNVGVMQRLVDANNKHDLKAMEAFFADDYKLIEIGQPKDLNRAEAMKSTKSFLAAFPDLRVTPVATWGAGDYVVLEGSITGTNKGAMPEMGIKKATNKPFTGRFLEVIKLDNGKIKEDWLFYNSVALAAQLGLK